MNTNADRREEMLMELERKTELPLLILSIVMIPLLLGPFLWELSETEDATFFALDTLIWALFAIDLGIKLAVAPERLVFLRSHWLEVLIVLIPFARPLRLLRLLVFGSRAFTGARRFANVDFLGVYAIGLIVIGATIVTTVEDGKDSQIDGFADALWWSIVTVTTVGYGDVVPTSAAGRAFAVVLMVGGIGIFGAATAQLASLFVRQDDAAADKEIRGLTQEVNSLRGEISELKDALTERR